MREQKGARVRSLEVFNVVALALHKRLKAAVGNLFVGKVSCETTMNQNEAN